MAYTRRKYGSYKGRKRTARSAKKSYRRSTVKTRRYAPKRKPMSRKMILNVTSRKKRDTMLNWSNTLSSNGNVTTPAALPYTTNGARTGWTVYCPTARTLLTNGVANELIDEADRTSHTCFYRGFSETVKIQTSSGIPWLWRRICFTLKDTDGPFQVIQASDASPATSNMSFADTTAGMTRTYIDVNLNNTPNTFVAQRNLLFQGQEGLDWNDIMTAKVDTTRVSLKYDKTRRIMSGNTAGAFKEYKLWHPMNKNLTYNDDENGPSEQGSYFSTSSKLGMGDYFIVDIFNPGTGSAVTDLLRVTSTSTLYWHEKS